MAKTKLKNVIFKNYLCCFSLTLATRLIALVGLTASTILASILVHDSRKNNYDISRKTALTLGLDWQHFHPTANTTMGADPEGKLISIIVIFYSVSYLLTSLTLLIATVLLNRWLTIPWLVFEILGCASKLAALIFHVIKTKDRKNKVFIVGSIFYIIIMTWWWLVVFAAQHSWYNHSSANYNVSKSSLAMSSIIERNTCRQIESVPQQAPTLNKQESVADSPLPYRPNEGYSCI